MNVELIRRLLRVADTYIREASVNDASAFRRIQAALDAVVFYETATRLATDANETHLDHNKTFTVPFSPHSQSLVRDLAILRQIYRKSCCDSGAVIQKDDVELSQWIAMRAQTMVTDWFRSGAIPLFSNSPRHHTCGADAPLIAAHQATYVRGRATRQVPAVSRCLK